MKTFLLKTLTRIFLMKILIKIILLKTLTSIILLENSDELWVDLKQPHISSAEHPLHCRIGAARQLKCKIIVKSVHWACCCIEAGGALPRKRRALLGLGWPACCPLADSQLSPVQIGDTGDGGSAAYIMVGWSGLENYCCDGWFSITSCCVWFLDAGMD